MGRLLVDVSEVADALEIVDPRNLMIAQNVGMRKTVKLDEDVAAAVERLRREEGLGLSEAVNRLARAGLTAGERRKPFHQRSYPLGMMIDVSNVAEALETIEGPEYK